MEYLIKEAFLHVDVYAVHVANGEYDLVGPHDEIIMKHVWEVVIQPGWEISMHMWPIPEPPPPEEVLVDGLADIVIVDEGAPPLPPPAPPAPGQTIGDGARVFPPSDLACTFGLMQNRKKGQEEEREGLSVHDLGVRQVDEEKGWESKEIGDDTAISITFRMKASECFTSARLHAQKHMSHSTDEPQTSRSACV